MWFMYGLKAQKFQKQHALKGQKLLAQGSALGIIAISKTPCKGVLDVTYDTPSLAFTFPFGR